MGAFRALEAYDSATNSWSELPMMPYPGTAWPVPSSETNYIWLAEMSSLPASPACIW